MPSILLRLAGIGYAPLWLVHGLVDRGEAVVRAPIWRAAAASKGKAAQAAVAGAGVGVVGGGAPSILALALATLSPAASRIASNSS